MDPLTGATTFATLVGLFGMFNTERKSQADAKEKTFEKWLREHRHDQLADLVVNNGVLTQSLGDLVESKHDEVMQRLDEMGRVMASVASNFAEFEPVVTAINAPRLSDQAMSILRQLNETDASKFLEIKTRARTVYQTMDGTPRVELTIDDPRFVEDDLDTLCECGLLGLDHGSRGSRIFVITRAGASVGGRAE